VGICSALIVLWSLTVPAAAQQAEPPHDSCAGDDAPKAADGPPAVSNDRLLWALPNFLTVEESVQVPALTARQKFHETIRSSFDYVDYGWYAFVAGLNQADHADPGYGSGASGYAKRYAAAFTDGTMENLMTSAVFPSVLRQDPRYYQLGKGGTWQRTWYSITRTVVTRSDTGHAQFNFSEILGGGVAAGLSNTYRSPRDRGLANTMSAWWTLVAYDTAQTVLREFWPDVRRKFSKR
jgi:hypothetical protein